MLPENVAEIEMIVGVGGIPFEMNSTPHTEKSSPSAPPTSASSRLSVSNCRTRRQRLAPSAVRTASSLCREEARTSRRFATLAHAMRSTKPTAPMRTMR